ncbi:MAG: hypothetical protein HY701_10995 [Gemmatimonadetes bacterium]|nr:hypothetical protein [Gemmatimonadota bacterium]
MVRTLLLACVLATLGGLAELGADPPRLTVGFRPAAGAEAVTTEITRPLPQQLATFESVRFISGRSAPEIGNSSFQLPVFTLGLLTLNPRYGDQRISFDFLGSAISGMGLDARAVRGLTASLAGEKGSATVLVGGLATAGGGLFKAPQPRLVAFTSALKPTASLVIAPRLVVPFGTARSPGNAEPTLGVGFRSTLSPHVTLVADLGRSRTPAGPWAHSAGAGFFGQWPRGSIELTTRHTDPEFSILGPVKFAAQYRRSAATRFLVGRGIAVEGLLAALRPTTGPAHAPVQLTASSAVRIDRLPRGALALSVERTAREASGATTMLVEWRDPGPTGVSIQFRQQRAFGRPAGRSRPHQQLHLQLRIPRSNPRQPSVELRSLVRLSGNQAEEPRLQTKVVAQIPVASRFALAADVEQNFLSQAAGHALRLFRVGADIAMWPGTSLRVTYAHPIGSALPMWKRVEASVTRDLSFW